jgi:hypothetical protein
MARLELLGDLQPKLQRLVDPLKRNPLPSQTELLRTFSYDPEEGILRWVHGTRAGPAGTEAGTLTKRGKRRIKYRGRFYYTSRIIYKILHNKEPLNVDHEDLNSLNNKGRNLRKATTPQNQMNTAMIRKSRSGVKGVRILKSGRIIAVVHIPTPVGSGKGKPIRLGSFQTVEQARDAYAKAARRVYGEFARTE